MDEFLPYLCYAANAFSFMSDALTTVDRDLFQSTISPCLPRVYRYCIALTADSDKADDVFQNALIKAFHKFPPQIQNHTQPGTQGVSLKDQDLTGWLCSLARYEYLESERTQRRRTALLDKVVEFWMLLYGNMPGAAQAPERPDAFAITAQAHDFLLSCLGSLGDKDREVIFLCDIEELGYEQAAAFLNIPLGTVKSRHHRARRKLRATALSRGVIAKDWVFEEGARS
jgi:RNA polymerase sigma-70 factor, ECF subfamily